MAAKLEDTKRVKICSGIGRNYAFKKEENVFDKERLQVIGNFLLRTACQYQVHHLILLTKKV